jgi:hypothetical protein
LAHQQPEKEHLGRIKEFFADDDAAYRVYVDVLPLIRNLIFEAKEKGCRFYDDRPQEKSFSLEMIFSGDNGEEHRANISFKERYERETGHTIGYRSKFKFYTAILNFVLNTAGIVPVEMLLENRKAKHGGGSFHLAPPDDTLR